MRYAEKRPVVGFEGRYEVSDSGEVFSLLRGIVMRPCSDKDGYQMLTLARGKGLSRKGFVKVHHIVASAFIGPRPEGLQVNHKDGNKGNNAVSNLEYVTQSENQRHRFDVLGVYGFSSEQRSEAAKTLWADPVYREKMISSRIGKATNKGYRCTPEQVLNRKKAARISNMKRNYSDGWRTEYVRRYPEHAYEVAL